jgi:hypothetical protein
MVLSNHLANNTRMAETDGHKDSDGFSAARRADGSIISINGYSMGDWRKSMYKFCVRKSKLEESN